MPLTVKNCLNRWCLRSANNGTAMDFINLLRERHGMDTMKGNHLKGRPPLRLACIAPHCDHWEAIDEEKGNCLIRCMMEAEEAGDR